MRWVTGFVVAGMMVLAGWAGVAGAQQAYQAPYEYYTNRPVSEVLPPEMISGPHFKVRDPVICDGYMDSFKVDTDWGVMAGTDDLALRKLLKEIKAIAALQEVKKNKVYLDAVVKSGTAPVMFAKDLITNPVDTVTGVPKGIGKLFENITTGLSSPKNPSQDSTAQALLGASQVKREWAHTLGVDPYSSNKVLQEELNSVAWTGAAGALTVSAALAPFGGPAALAISYTRLAQEFNNSLKDSPPAELRRINAGKLSAMGVSEELANKFLDHRSYTPRHNTIIVGSLEKLGNIPGRDQFIQFALSADDEGTANFFQYMAETLRGYHEGVAPITRLQMVSGVILAQAANQTVLIPFPLDYGVWTLNAENLMKSLLTNYQQAGFNGPLQMWVTGTLSARAKENLEKLGIGFMERAVNRIEYQY
jgi:hypothetical protein